MLRHEGMQFQVCKNRYVKCAVVQRAHGTIWHRLYKYITYKNTYRYVDVLPKFVEAYNDTVHSTTGMAPSRLNDSDVLTLRRWIEAEAERSRFDSEVSRRAARAYQ